MNNKHGFEDVLTKASLYLDEAALEVLRKAYLFADEITNSLNKKMALRIINRIIKYQKEKNLSFILITHDESLLKLFDQVYFMKN